MGWLVGHLVGDYLLQNDWMAQGKKRDHLPCLVHVAIYTLAVMLCTAWPLWAAVAVFVPWYMRAIGQTQFMEPPMSPWSRIAVDNVMHVLCLFLLDVTIITSVAREG